MESQINYWTFLMTFMGTLYAIAGAILTIIGYFKFKSADNLVKEKVEEKLEEKLKLFESNLGSRLDNIQESMMKCNAAYEAMRNKQYDQAIELLLMAEKVFPYLFNLYNTLGYAYLEKNQQFKAVDAFKKAVELRPDRVEGYNDVARAYAIAGEYQFAIDYLEKALKKDALKVLTYIDTDPAFDNLKNDEKAGKMFKELVDGKKIQQYK